jgi:hypothetical protein
VHGARHHAHGFHASVCRAKTHALA